MLIYLLFVLLVAAFRVTGLSSGVYDKRGKIRPDGKREDEPFAWPGLPPLGQDSVILSLF